MPVTRDGDDPIFVKDGAQVKFCFHRSVTQGRGRITRDVERHGGKIVSNERDANVLIVDEQEDIEFIRRRYYSSTERYRLSIYVEPRGFVQTCIRAGTYRHAGPVQQGMPGRAPGRRRARVPFTEEDRDHLAYYLATRCPMRDGRMGNNPYKDLERLGQTEDPTWAWARRHTFHSWREHYKLNTELMDARIAFYLQRLKDVGHHFGHDPRSHDFRNLRRQLAEEEEEGEEREEEGRHQQEEEEQEEIDQREGSVRPAAVPPRQQDQVARHNLARHERDIVIIEEDESDQEVAEQQPHAKRQRVQPDAHDRHRSREGQAKKAHVSNGDRVPGIGEGQDKRAATPEDDMDMEDSQELEGSDLFGDREYGSESHAEFDDQAYVEPPVPFSPRASPAPEHSGPPPSTQATLVASPRFVEKGPSSDPMSSPTRAVEARVRMPPSTLVAVEERVVTRVQSGPSLSQERSRRGVAVVNAPYRNTRARSRSVESQAQVTRERKGQERKENVREDMLEEIEEDIEVVEASEEEEAGEAGTISVAGGISVAEEMAVEGLLEGSASAGKDEEETEETGRGGDEHNDNEETEGTEELSDGGLPQLSRFQEIEDGDTPSDSDDAETHESLTRGIKEESVDGSEDDAGRESESEAEAEVKRETDDAAQVERMASGKLRAVPAPTPLRVTRSRATVQTQTRSQSQISPRRTRSVTANRGAPSTVFPSPGTKARAVVNRVREEEREMPYEPPRGSRAARVVRGRGKRGV